MHTALHNISGLKPQVVFPEVIVHNAQMLQVLLLYLKIMSSN